MYHKMTKYIVVGYHFIWDVMSKGVIVLKKIPMANNPVDMTTKPIITLSSFGMLCHKELLY